MGPRAAGMLRQAGYDVLSVVEQSMQGPTDRLGQSLRAKGSFGWVNASDDPEGGSDAAIQARR